jgi:Ser/Thr protein kinase RdoA (MazF antagonist)
VVDSIAVMHSLLSSTALGKLTEHYEVGQALSCRLLTRGLNDTYKLETNTGTYILRVYRAGWRSVTDIHYELEVIRHLAMHGTPVSIPLQRTDGGWFTNLGAPEGIRHAVLFSFAEGEIPILDEATCRLYGETLAQIHNHSDEFHSRHDRFPLDLDHLLDKPLQSIERLMTGQTEDIRYLQELAQKMKSKLPVEALTTGFCHGDFHDWNTHLHRGSLTVFDFDCCGQGFHAYDIAVFLWNLKNNYRDKEEAGWPAFLDGYRQHRPLSPVDLDWVPLFVTVRRIWLMGIYASNEVVWGTGWATQNNFQRFLSDLRRDELEWSSEESTPRK